MEIILNNFLKNIITKAIQGKLANVLKRPLANLIDEKNINVKLPSQQRKVENDVVLAAKQWKIFPDSNSKEFNYQKPLPDTGFLGEGDVDLKNEVQKRCLLKMKESMNAMDCSLVDTIRELLKEGALPRAQKTMNDFANRVLDLYEAYVEVQLDEGINELPLEIGYLKANGFTHKELLDLKEVCIWYGKQIEEFQQDLEKLGLNFEDSQVVVNYFAKNSYKWRNPENKNNERSEEEQKFIDLLQKHSDKQNLLKNIEKSCKSLRERFLKNNENFKTIQSFNHRVSFINSLMTQQEKEEIKQKLTTEYDQYSSFLSGDPKHRLLQEIRQRFDSMVGEPGYVSNPLTFVNIVRGKHDLQNLDSSFRTKLFFIYGSKNIVNEVAADPVLAEKINKKLAAKGKNWSIDENLCATLRNGGGKSPVYRLGVYAKENHVGKKLRRRSTPQEVAKFKREDPNKTFAEYEQIASGNNVSDEDLNTRFRFPLYPAEEMLFFGTNKSLDEKEHRNLRRQIGNGNQNRAHSNAVADTSFQESYIDYKKKEMQNPWKTGRDYWITKTKKEFDTPYLSQVEDLGLPSHAGISGSTDQTMTMAGVVGINSINQLMDLRLLYIPWMTGHEDHSAHEILTAAKSFNLPYTPSVDYHKRIYPEQAEEINKRVEKYQRMRGLEMPEYYLSEQYAREVADKVRDEKRQQVESLMKNHQLFLQGTRSFRTNYSTKDPFADNKFLRATAFLTDEKVNSVNEVRKKKQEVHNDYVKYTLDYELGKLAEHKKQHFYKGTRKRSISLVPPKGKIIPYVPHDNPSLNRVGLLFDRSKCQVKEDKYVYKYDAHVDSFPFWKKSYTKDEIKAPEFKERLKKDSEEALAFSEEKAHHIPMEELISQNEKNADSFVPYNEINGSLNNDGIVGVFTFSRGCPTYTDRKKEYRSESEQLNWKPLDHEAVVEHKKNEDYDLYMLLMGIGKRICVMEQFGKDVPLFEINETLNKGLSYVSHESQIRTLETILKNKNNELERVAKMVIHQSTINASLDEVKKSVEEKVKAYLAYMDPQANKTGSHQKVIPINERISNVASDLAEEMY